MAVERAVVFVGPSLGGLPVPVAGIEFRPPAARGDLIALAAKGFEIAGLIDGVFHQQLAVTPREVRETAAAGVRLFGAASLGALRACECPDAMEGVGEVYQAFERGELSDDDEVAVTFDPTSMKLLSYPMVQIRAAFRLTAARFPSSEADFRQLLAEIHEMSFEARSARTLRQLAEQQLSLKECDALTAALDSEQADIKRKDALMLVERVRALLARASRP